MGGEGRPLALRGYPSIPPDPGACMTAGSTWGGAVRDAGVSLRQQAHEIIRVFDQRGHGRDQSIERLRREVPELPEDPLT